MKTQDICEVTSLTPQDFITNYFNIGKPVIIRGGLRDNPALNWSVGYLKSKCGENVVHVRQNTHCEAYKVGQKYNIEQIPFKKLADLITEDSPDAAKYYLAASNIKTGFPQIKQEFYVPTYVQKVFSFSFFLLTP
eukprot:TRINITY_DN5152_c0_g2_i4.p1 TRINITY_DN5152_c0_g2~~TRINITY_DN5152_c0_g2_i4.p1  ORF type:complete len:135 (-),score=24.42 TRINITY_DN5152_c0_g2_i4:21-425(-)